MPPVEQDATSYGNKYKNLIRLRNIFADIPEVSVPEFIGISTERVMAFLEEAQNACFADYQKQTQQLAGRITPELELTAKDLQSYIESHFNRLGSPYFPFTAAEESFFKQIENGHQSCMVRSTGIEDSQTIANAGGNTSIAYVYPSVPWICEAMGKVIASYFGIPSLKNRIAGGEDIAKTPLCMPVLIQRCIGEKDDYDAPSHTVPISGVAFTTNQPLSAPGFSVTEINASYGHGEGIVANRVATDRYYVVPSRTHSDTIDIYPMIYYKSERLVPENQTQKLVIRKNSIHDARRACLSQEQIKILHRALKKIEAAYEQPMDVEFVILNTTIYIVQARPAMRHTAHPSYVNTEKIPADTLSLTTIIPGTSQVVISSNPTHDILIASTLDEADQIAHSTSAKAVIVGSWASPLSHAAVNFMSHGIPCFYSSDLQTVKKMVATVSPEYPIVIDVQRHVLFTSDHTMHTAITHGWLEHPIHRATSVPDEPHNTVHISTITIPQDGVVATLMQQLARGSTKQEQKECLAAIEARIMRRLQLSKKRMQHMGVFGDALQQMYDKFKTQITHLIETIHSSIDQHADQFELLFYHKMLEALLYQSPESTDVLGAYNYNYFLNKLFSQQMVFMTLQKSAHSASDFSDILAYAEFCPVSVLQEQYCTFIRHLTAYTNHADTCYATDIASFKMILAQLNTIHSLPIWFSTEFYQAYKHYTPSNPQTARTMLSELIKPYAQIASLHTATQIIKEYADGIQTIRTQSHSTFTSQQEVEHVWNTVQRTIIAPLTSTAFITSISEAPTLVRHAAYDSMRIAVDTIDTIIKTVKTSVALSAADKMELFKKLVSDFHGLFHVWMQNIDHTIYNNHMSYLQEIRSQLYHIVTQPNDPVMFHRSSTFSVQAALFTSHTTFSRHYPQSVEDMFMLIHQNSLALIGQLQAQLFHDKPLTQCIWLPHIVQDLITAFESTEARNMLRDNNASQPNCIGIEYGNDNITLRYNMPLRSHSATFQIIYNLISQECYFTMQCLGPARSRWREIAQLVTLSKTQFSDTDDSMLDEQAGIVSWKWRITTKRHLSLLPRYLAMIAYLSYERSISTWVRCTVLLETEPIAQPYTQKLIQDSTWIMRYIATIVVPVAIIYLPWFIRLSRHMARGSSLRHAAHLVDHEINQLISTACSTTLQSYVAGKALLTTLLNKASTHAIS